MPFPEEVKNYLNQWGRLYKNETLLMSCEFTVIQKTPSICSPRSVELL